MRIKTLIIVALAMITCCQVNRTLGSGVFEINIASLFDAYGRDLREECCSWQNQTLDNFQRNLPPTHPAYQQLHQNALNLNQQNQQQQQQQQQQQNQCDPSKCQLIIRICVKNFQTQIDSSQCTFGELTAQVMKSNEPYQFAQYPNFSHTFTNSLNQYSSKPVASGPTAASSGRRQASTPAINIHHQRMLFQQPITSRANQQSRLSSSVFASGQPRALRTIAFHQPIAFPFNFTWPGSFSLVIDAWFESPTGQVALPFATGTHPFRTQYHQKPMTDSSTTYDLYKKQLIITHSMNRWLDIKDEWTNDIHRTVQASLTYSYRVTCQQNYYGEQCNILCRPRNDAYGHYTCSQQGEKVCLAGWSGSDSYCLEPICSPGCQGNCSRPNECNCRPGWTGAACEQCIRHPRCMHGSCNKPHECICDEGWGGLFCTEDLNVCANQQPCRNGGLCTNTFDSKGSGSYQCECPEGFSGNNCERRPGIQYRLVPVALDASGASSSTNSATASSHQASQTGRNQTSATGGAVPSGSPTARSSNERNSQTFQQHPKLSARSQPMLHPSLHYPAPPAAGSTSQPGLMWADKLKVGAYGVIIVCIVILAAVFVLRRWEPHSSNGAPSGRHWHNENCHHEEVAAYQNHQNIYKSRSSLACSEKMAGGGGGGGGGCYDSVDSACSSLSRGSATSSAASATTTTTLSRAAENEYASRSLRSQRRHHSQHNLDDHQHQQHAPPPPPYTISHSHPTTSAGHYKSSTAAAAAYYNSIYNLSTAAARTISSGVLTNAASIYNMGPAEMGASGGQLVAGRRRPLAAPGGAQPAVGGDHYGGSVYGSQVAAAAGAGQPAGFQQPCFVIYATLPQ